MGAHLSVPMYRRNLRQRLVLEGQRCTACGRTQFPPLARCGQCRGQELQPYRLGGAGVVVAATYITPAGAPPEFAAQARAAGGYGVAIIQLDDGPRITGQTVGEAAIGQRVRAVIRRLYEEDGVVRYGFKFAPEEGGTP